MTHRRLYALAALATLAVAAPALAQPAEGDAIATAASPTVFPAEPFTAAPEMLAYEDPFGLIAPPVVRDGKLHGMVQFGVGTGGFRQAAAAISGPIGDNGYFALVVSDTQFSSSRARKAAPATAPAPAP